MPTLHRAAFIILPLTLGFAFAGCDQGSPSASSSKTTPTAPAVTANDIAGTWELHPDSVAAVAHNSVIHSLESTGEKLSESEIADEAKQMEPRITAANVTSTFHADGRFILQMETTKNGAWTLDNGVVSVTIPGDPDIRRLRYERGALISIPRTEKYRETKWRRK